MLLSDTVNTLTFPVNGHANRRQLVVFVREEKYGSTSGRVGRHSAVGTATRYGLDGPGIESRWGRDFPHPSRPTVGPSQPPIGSLSRG